VCVYIFFMQSYVHGSIDSVVRMLHI